MDELEWLCRSDAMHSESKAGDSVSVLRAHKPVEHWLFQSESARHGVLLPCRIEECVTKLGGALEAFVCPVERKMVNEDIYHQKSSLTKIRGERRSR